TDDAQLVEAAGHPVHVVEGAATNVKITTKADLVLAEAVLKAQPKPKVAGSGHPFADEEMWGGRGPKGCLCPGGATPGLGVLQNCGEVMPPPVVSRHPLVLHKLALLRDQATEPPVFRAMVRDLAKLLFYEATLDLGLEPVTVRTPLAECAGHRLAGQFGLVPILRAGLGMADAILELVPDSRVWHLGLYRDHQTLKPVTYYNKLPPVPDIDVALVVDPMLATGGSAVAAIDILRRWGVRRIKFLGLIAAP